MTANKKQYPPPNYLFCISGKGVQIALDRNLR